MSRPTLQHTTTLCNTLVYCCDGTATHCNSGSNCHCNNTRWTMLRCAHCSTLQHTATYCNTLQHTATHCRKRMRNQESVCQDTNYDILRLDAYVRNTSTYTLQYTNINNKALKRTNNKAPKRTNNKALKRTNYDILRLDFRTRMESKRYTFSKDKSSLHITI